jgi:putative transposase
MANPRKLVFQNENFYHVFNRGLDRRITFSSAREYKRAQELLEYYQYNKIPIRYSRYLQLKQSIRQQYLESMRQSGKKISIVAYCLMPNHFHLLLKQCQEDGISMFVGNFMNAYTKYYNTRYERTGPLFQGVFKAVFVESEDQLAHVARYIHLNPVAASIINPAQLETYQWFSHQAYLNSKPDQYIDKNSIKLMQSLVPDYKTFVTDQISYSKELSRMKHLLLE